jgi:hypothetical protein
MKKLRVCEARLSAIGLIIIFLLHSPGVLGQQEKMQADDSTAYSVKRIIVHGKTLIGYIIGNTFYLTTTRGKVLLQSDGGCSSWNFTDFNGDGFKDIVVSYVTNTPDENDLYLYVASSHKFVRVQHFLDFPAAERIPGTHYYYSYHHSGCADQNWDSDLFYFRDFQAVRLGNISGVGCPADDREKEAIYIHRIRGARGILVNKYPISVVGRYRKNKWGFIKQYWTSHYPLFQDSLSIKSGKYFISGDFALDTVMRLPEIIDENDYIQRKTKEKRKLFPLLYGEPDKDHPYYWVAVGEDNGMSFVTHFGFHVDATSGTIHYYDALTGEVLDLRSWRKTYQVALPNR